jgi:hypothetical protein
VAGRTDGGQGRRAEGYEPPRLTVHGSLAEATAANLIGTEFDKTIPAGASILSVFGGTSL